MEDGGREARSKGAAGGSAPGGAVGRGGVHGGSEGRFRGVLSAYLARGAQQQQRRRGRRGHVRSC
jgi:hypothetical protein